MKLVIVLRKDVDDKDQGQAIFEIVVSRLADRPDVEVTGSVSDTLEMETP